MKEIPIVKQFPAEGFDNSQVDVLNIRKVYFSGLYERTVLLADGTPRSYKAYIPSTANYGDDQLPLCAWRNGNFGKLGKPGYIPPNRHWLEEDSSEIDNRFVRAMLEKLFTQYNIDKTRMYITGQSNGCVMTQMMSEKGADLFAAAASTGMPVQVAHTPLPNFIVGGEFDICPVTLTAEGRALPTEAEERFREALALRGVDYESGGRFRNGVLDNREWRDENGVPVMRFCCVLGQAHSWRQNMCRVFWDEWFCRFSRDPDTGKILYMGK